MKKHADQPNNVPEVSRRSFLGQTIAGAAALGHYSAVKTFAAQPNPGLPNSKVVIVRNPNAVNKDGSVNAQLVEAMVAEAMTTFTGKETLADAWKTIVKPEDAVSLKVNGLGLSGIKETPMINHFAAVSDAIVKGVTLAGTDQSKMVIWDRDDGELTAAGYKLQTSDGALRVMGNNKAGYSAKQYTVGKKKSRLSKSLTDLSNVLINVPVLKSHMLAGSTGALKNHYGTIDNPRSMHKANCTNPGIPQINELNEIRSKQRLVVYDALLGVSDGGPWWKKAAIWHNGAILVATDPVAVDAVALKMLNDRRAEEGLKSVDHKTGYLAMCQDLKIGNANLANIDIVEKNIGQNMKKHVLRFGVLAIAAAAFLSALSCAGASRNREESEASDTPFKIQAFGDWQDVENGYLTYTAQTMFDLINGGAELYIMQGMVDGIFHKMNGKDTQLYDALFMNFGNEDNALQMFEMRVGDLVEPVQIPGYPLSMAAARTLKGSAIVYVQFKAIYGELNFTGFADSESAIKTSAQFLSHFTMAIQQGMGHR